MIVGTTLIFAACSRVGKAYREALRGGAGASSPISKSICDVTELGDGLAECMIDESGNDGSDGLNGKFSDILRDVDDGERLLSLNNEGTDPLILPAPG